MKTVTAENVLALRPTNGQYGNFQLAYDFFNVELFDGKLPDIMFTMARKPHSRGYFHANKFGRRVCDGSTIIREKGEEKLTTAHELCLNPDTFHSRTDRDILSTLVHEMCHVWQYVFGKMPSGGYHDREWGNKMKECGLHPSNTGMVGGKETGRQMTHYIIEGGKFDVLCKQLLNDGFSLNWQSFIGREVSPATPTAPGVYVVEPPVKAKQTRQKFSCPACGQNAWAKPGAKLFCGECVIIQDGVTLGVHMMRPV